MRLLTLRAVMCGLCLAVWARAAGAVVVGAEGVRYFGNHNAQSTCGGLNELCHTFDICDGFYSTLAGSSGSFHYHRTSCWERDLRDVGQGGLDSSYADKADIFLLVTHGNNNGSAITLAYDCANGGWHSDSTKWKLGDQNLEWLALYACRTIPFSSLANTCSRFFYGLHMVLGSHDSLYDSCTTDECGEDFAQNLLDGDLISDAWLDGIDDWWCDQNAAVAAAERYETYRGGNYDWPNTTMHRDHYWGHGYTCADIPHNQVYWFSYRWIN